MALNRESLTQFFVTKFGLEPEDLEDEAPIFSQGLLDSFHLVDLVTHIESSLEIKMGAMEVNLNNLDSIEKILAYAATKG